MDSKLTPPDPLLPPENEDEKDRDSLQSAGNNEERSTILNKRKKLELGEDFGENPTHTERMESLKGDSEKLVGTIKRNIDSRKL